MQSLEEQLNLLKEATDQSFYNAQAQARAERRGDYGIMPVAVMSARRPDEQQLLETVRSGGSTVQHTVPQSKQAITANVTHEQFKLTDRNSAVNSKMLSTYRGNDNMKLRVFDQVLKGKDSTSQASSKQRQQHQQQLDAMLAGREDAYEANRYLMQETHREPRMNQDIILDMPHLEE